MKFCSKCKIQLSENNFTKSQYQLKFGRCKICIREYNRIYRATHLNEKKRKYVKNRYHNDIKYKMRIILSRSINKYLKKYNLSKNGKSCLSYLPYTMEELKKHLENQFETWMTWNNQGKYNSKIWNDQDTSTWTWQIDHIIPQSKFAYVSMEDKKFEQCWALSNLRPYSAKQNLLDNRRD